MQENVIVLLSKVSKEVRDEKDYFDIPKSKKQSLKRRYTVPILNSKHGEEDETVINMSENGTGEDHITFTLTGSPYKIEWKKKK